MFVELGSALYKAFLKKDQSVNVPSEYVDIVRKVMNKIGWSTQVNGITMKGSAPAIPENKKVMVGLSGGMDSVYLMHKLKEQGYEVYAVHVAGLNKQSLKFEERSARETAQQAGAKYTLVKFSAPKQAFPDNPFKNQMILSLMLDIGIQRGIYRYAIGSDWTTPLSEAVVGFTITDSVEVNRSFWEGIKNRFNQAELVFIPDDVKKFDRITYLYDKGVLNSVSSCVSPFRFRDSLHKKNVEKYGIKLMRGRCGSCYKCAMEYILLVESGRIKKDTAFYNHSWEVLAKSKTAHRPDLFALSLPIEKRMRNLKNYGS